MGTKNTLADIGIAMSSPGTVIAGLPAYSAKQKNDAVAQQNKAARTQRRMQSYQSAVERRKQVAQALRGRAEIANTAYTQGSQGSSGVIGSQDALFTQAGSNIAHLNTMEKFNKETSRYMVKANEANARAATADAAFETVKSGASLFV